MRRVLLVLLALLFCSGQVLAQQPSYPTVGNVPWSMVDKPTGVSSTSSLGAEAATARAAEAAALAKANAAVPSSQVNAPNGVAPTDGNNQLPLANINLRALALALQTVYPGVPTIVSQPANLQDFQRASFTGGALNLGTATGSVTLSLPASANLVEAEIVDASTGAVVAPYTSISTGIGPGAQTLTFPVPARAGWDKLKLRFNGDPASEITGTTQFGAGDLHMWIGQSLAVAMFVDNVAAGDTQNMTTLGIVPTPFSSAIGSWGTAGIGSNNYPAQWGPISPTGIYNSAFMGKFVNYELALTNVNQSIVAMVVGGASSTNFLPTAPASSAIGFGGLNYYQVAQNLMAQAGGNFLDLTMRQGHQDADVNVAAPAWVASWQTIVNGLQAGSSRRMNRVYATIPSVYSCYVGGLTMQSTAAIRSGGEILVSDDPGSTLVQSEDVAPGLVDCVHPLQASLANFDAAHYFRATAAVDGFRPLADSDIGPRITGVTWAAGQTSAVLSVAQNQGSALVGVGAFANQFQVYNSGSTTTQFPVTSAVLTDANHITLNFATAPTPASGALDVWVRPIFDTQATTAAGIYDNATDAGDGITQGRQLYTPSYPITTTPGWTNLVESFDFSHPIGVAFTDPACSAQASPGQQVQCVKGSSGAQYVAPALSQAPTLTANAINGQTGLCFNSASSQILKNTTASFLATMKASTTITGSMVEKSTTVTNAYPFSVGSANNSLFNTLAFGVNIASGPNLRALRSSDNASTGAINTPTGSLIAGGLYKSVFQWNGFGSAEFLDVNALPEVTMTAPAGTDTSTWGFAQLGALPTAAGGSTFYFNGCIGELELENNADSAAFRAVVQSYYTGKWGS